MKAYYGQSKEGKALVFNERIGYVRMGGKAVNWALVAVLGLAFMAAVGFWVLAISK